MTDLSSPAPDTVSPDAPSSDTVSPDTPSPESGAESPVTDVQIIDDPTAEPPPSYVKLAMRNMVRKGGKSLFHFFLTTTGLIGLFIGLAYLTR